MSTHKHIDRICALAAVLSLLLCLIFMNASTLGMESARRTMGYESRLFSTDRVHSIDIVMEDWNSFIASAQSEEYSPCTVVIDGESYTNVGIRGKGNTSLSTVAGMDSQRYSFKLEFDRYDSTKSYHGLDKLSLNNIIQDSTYMKDYLSYRLMAEFGAAAPLCSYVFITVNGEDWGLYLAVEGIEDAFLQRSYGSDHGELYKPDSMSMGGGRGNGRDFSMQDFSADSTAVGSTTSEGGLGRGGKSGGEIPENFDPSSILGGNGGIGFGNMFIGGGMGSSDVKLQYIDDEPDSYSNIFSNAKTDISPSDESRLIASLKELSSGENIESVVDVDAALRYFVVHNYVVNGDSYTGSMVHNYYLYEEGGLLSMIAWDYNLAYGTFMGGQATESVNDPIDSPLSVGSGDRPMIDWVFSSEEYTALYHRYFAEFLDTVDAQTIIDDAEELIAPYVETDPSAFYSYDEFEVGVDTLRDFCALRSESIRGQLDGSIPSTSEGQSVDSSTMVNADHLSLSDMGSMSMGGGKGFGNMDYGGAMPDFDHPSQIPESLNPSQMPEVFDSSAMPQMPEGMDMGQFPGGETFSGQGFDAKNFTPPDAPTMGSGETVAPESLPMRDSVSPPGTAAPASSSINLLLLAASAVVLVVGLVIAAKYKR